MQDPAIRRAIADLGNELRPDTLPGVAALFDGEQRQLAAAWPPSAVDCVYGPHERHRLDVFAPPDARNRPVLIFVHGGGFMRGDKGDGGSWLNANVGRMAAQSGMVGVVINYRLAPEYRWPAGADDLALAVQWVRDNIAGHGGDGEAIIVSGSSAGAVHVAGFLHQYSAAAGVRGAILLSGLYGITELTDVRDLSYYGDDPACHAEMMPVAALAQTPLPLFVLAAEFDPPRFQAEFVGLLQRRLASRGALPRAYLATGHNHYSLAFHLGGADRRVSNEIADFVQSCCGIGR